MPQVYLLVGRIAAGKTHYANHLMRTAGVVPLSCDDLILQLFDGCLGDRHDKITARASAFLFGQAKTLYDMGLSSSLDFGFWTPETRDAAKAYFAAHGIPVTTVYLNPPDALRRTRLAARNEKLKGSTRREYIIDFTLLKRLDQKFIEPQPHEYDLYITDQEDLLC